MARMNFLCSYYNAADCNCATQELGRYLISYPHCMAIVRWASKWPSVRFRKLLNAAQAHFNAFNCFVKRLYTTQDFALLSHLKNMLSALGIDCQIRGEHLSIGMGELPPIECWPELWVCRAEQYDEAENLLRKLLYIGSPVGEPWICATCSEEIQGQFTDCWQCGQSRP